MVIFDGWYPFEKQISTTQTNYTSSCYTYQIDSTRYLSPSLQALDENQS